MKPPPLEGAAGEFVLGAEQEFLTLVDGSDDPLTVPAALREFLDRMAQSAPSLPGPQGFFNPYGRVYVDCGMHLEFASSECASPFELVRAVEQQEQLAARALAARRAEGGKRVALANDNHSGLLTVRSPTFGSHENYLVAERPSSFTRFALPFLASRVWAGAGGVLYPTAAFVASVRVTFMQLETDGATTERRALHGTCREEHLMARACARFRYHLISGDGHQSQFNRALHWGATALAIKAIQHDRELRENIERLEAFAAGGNWVGFAKRVNVLARAGCEPRVAPEALAIQRAYLAAAERVAERLVAPPAWIETTLRDWRATLDAYERDDRDWLVARLDAYAKHAVYSQVLAANGLGWRDLAWRRDRFAELALLDQSYHAVGEPNSLFQRLERSGLLAHRVVEPLEPGAEREPWVPETTTRARARARFLVANRGSRTLIVDWANVYDLVEQRVAPLEAPFAAEFGDWRAARDPRSIEFDPRAERQR
jgi:hypothetical protein